MRVAAIVTILALLIALSALDSSIAKTQPASMKKADSVLVALTGEFRTVFANLLWIKAEKYHHEYTADGKDWAQNTDLMGLNRIITKLDPRFDEAYAIGGRLMMAQGKVKDAQAYLEEGVTNNPNSMMLHDEYGTMLARHGHDYESSLYHLKRAYLLTNDSWHRRRLKKLIHTVEGMQGMGAGDNAK